MTPYRYGARLLFLFADNKHVRDLVHFPVAYLITDLLVTKIDFGAQSGVPGNVEPNQVLSGTPVMPHREWLKSSTLVPKLPEFRKTLSALERRVAELEEKLAQKGE